MPWIFACLMVINAVFFGWKFMEGSTPQGTVKEKSIPQEGARIQLLSESNLPRREAEAPAPGSEVAEGGEGAPPAAAVVAAPRQCFDVGPFASDQDARSFAAGMKGKRFSVRIEKRKVNVRDYWVFIPAFTNRERAEEKLRDLRARGIEGFVVKEGMFVNAISLNHFSQKDLAQAFLARMREAGVAGESREQTSVGSESWAYVAPAQSGNDLKGAIDAYLSSRDGLKREITACEE